MSENQNESQDWNKIKANIKKEDAQNEELSIEELQNLMSDTEDVTSKVTDPILPQTDELQKMFEDNYQKANHKARVIIKSLASFYLDTDMLEEDYVKSKIKQDVLNFSIYMYNIDQNRDMMNEIIREIKTGNVSARMFEVFSTLQKTNLSLIKDKKQYMQIMEAEYEQFRDTVLEAQNRIEGLDGKAIEIDYNESEENIFRGSKELLNQIIDEADDIIPDEQLEISNTEDPKKSEKDKEE